MLSRGLNRGVCSDWLKFIPLDFDWLMPRVKEKIVFKTILIDFPIYSGVRFANQPYLLLMVGLHDSKVVIQSLLLL